MKIVLTAVLVGVFGGVGLGQVIRLKPLVSADLRQDVRVGDVASVTGAGAEEVANTVLVAGIDKPMQVKAESVLMAVMTQRGTGLGGNMQMGGAAVCQVEIKGAPRAVAEGEKGGIEEGNGMKGGGKTGAPERVLGSVEGVNGSAKGSIGAENGSAKGSSGVVNGSAKGSAEGVNGEGKGSAAEGGGASLRNVIVNRILQDTGVGAEDLRVEFNTTSPLVDGAVGSGQRWLVRPLTRTMLGTVQFEAQLAEGTKVLQRMNVPTEVQRRQRVVVVTARLLRGSIVTAEMLRHEDAWMDRTVPTLFGAVSDVVGLEAQRDVEIGSQADQRDFKPLLMARKGDLVTVVYMAGALEVQIKGRAMADGKFHEVIDVRNETTGEKYGAVMVKKGVGVAGAVTEEQERRVVGN